MLLIVGIMPFMVTNLSLASQSEAETLFDDFMREALPDPSLFNACKITYHARSAFIALSGNGDDFSDALDIPITCRSGIYLPGEAIPMLEQRNLSGNKLKYNPYLLDMWNWRNLGWLHYKNKIRDADLFAQARHQSTF